MVLTLPSPSYTPLPQADLTRWMHTGDDPNEKSENQAEGKEDNRPMTNVTNRIKQMSNGMDTGQMLSSEKFNLYESMTAIEIGTGGMDPGMSTNAVHPQGFVPPDIEQLTPTEILNLVDTLLVLLLRQHKGQNVVNSIHICTLYHTRRQHPATGPNASLVALVMDACLLNALYSISVALKTDTFCDEEDFAAPTRDHTKFSPDRFPKSEPIHAAISSHLESPTGHEDPIDRALRQRLMFLQTLLRIHELLLPPQTSAEEKEPPPKKSTYTKLGKLAKEALKLVEGMASTELDGYGPAKENLFDPRLTSPRCLSQPPKKYKPPTLPDDLSEWQNFFVGLRELSLIANDVKSLPQLLERLQMFSKLNPCTTVRIYAVRLTIFPETFLTRGTSKTQMVSKAFQLLWTWARPWLGFEDNAIFKEFMQSAEAVIHATMRFWLSNRSRQHVNAPSLLSDYAQLYEHARAIDQNQYGNWVTKVNPPQATIQETPRQNFSDCVAEMAYPIVFSVIIRPWDFKMMNETEIEASMWAVTHFARGYLMFDSRSKPVFHLMTVKDKTPAGKKAAKKRKKQAKKESLKDDILWNRRQGLAVTLMRALNKFAYGNWLMLQGWRILARNGLLDGPVFRRLPYGNNKKRFERRYAPFRMVNWQQTTSYKIYREATFAFYTKTLQQMHVNQTSCHGTDSFNLDMVIGAVQFAMRQLKEVNATAKEARKQDLGQGSLTTTMKQFEELGKAAISTCMAGIQTLKYIKKANNENLKETKAFKLKVEPKMESLWTFHFVGSVVKA